jgi:beta-glucuronidase
LKNHRGDNIPNMIDTKRISLSHVFWKFRYGLSQNETGEDPGIIEAWYKSGIPTGPGKLKVYVPGSWAYYQNRKNFYHFGTGWYETSFYLPETWGSADGKKVTLVFKGSNYKTSVWLNGQKVGEHEGGYTKFWFEVNDFLKFGADNHLIICVDNRYMKNRIPWHESCDWMNYGGLYRSVYLKLTSKVCINEYNITNEIQFDKPLGEGYEKTSAKLNVRFYLKDSRPRQPQFQGALIFSIKNQEFIDSTEVPVELNNISDEYISASITIQNPHLWSPEFPYLYNVTFQLLDRYRNEMDRVDWRYGIREFKIEGSNFYLNNSKYLLRGINHHQDHPAVGASLSTRLIYNDLNIMKDANINAIRTSHYPPHQEYIELADEMGFLIFEELPLFRLKKENYNASTLVNAQQQMFEMINRDKNHSSVVAWILSNECDLESPEGLNFMSALMEVGRELDPSRYFSMATKNPMSEEACALVDFVSYNIYTGWKDQYYVKASESSEVLDDIWEKMSSHSCVKGPKPFIIAKFGAGAVSGYKDFANAKWSENFQYDFLRSYLTIIGAKEYISGAFLWHFHDFRISPYDGFHNRPKEYNNSGILNANREPKIAFYIIQSTYQKWKEKSKLG